MLRRPVPVGRSPAFQRFHQMLLRVAPLRHPVLLRGETGTGKELAARVLHEHGRAPAGPWVAVNCAAIPDGLAESELFGHVRGAFTGAHRTHAGAFSRADGGTLFLDEVAELPLVIQAKLLRVLETRCVVPVGSETEIEVDVRIVAATHRDLEAMIKSGHLREDLYHRLGVLPVRVPPLRDRRDDIGLLITQFAREAEHELGRTVRITPAAIRAAETHAWPGNVRGLRNAVFRAAALADGPIMENDLIGPFDGFATDVEASSAEGDIQIPRGDYATMRRTLLELVVAQEGSIRRAARALGVPRSTLGAWLKQ